MKSSVGCNRAESGGTRRRRRMKMAKKQQVAFDATKGTVTVTYPTIGKSVAVDLNKLSEEVKWQGLGHGIKQRLVPPHSSRADTRQRELPPSLAAPRPG